MRGALLGVLGALLATAAAAQDLTVAAVVAGCAGPREGATTHAETLARIGRAAPSLGGDWIYVSATPDAKGETALLCVALLRADAGGYVRIARGEIRTESDTPWSRFVATPSADVNPFEPESIFSLNVTAWVKTDSSNSGVVTVYLLRRANDRLEPVFRQRMMNYDVDKAGDRRATLSCGMRTDGQSQRRPHDVVTNCGKGEVRFVWNGARYVEVVAGR